jgi:hypothetical protein
MPVIPLENILLGLTACKDDGSSCDGVRLPFQHCSLGLVVLSLDESEYD